MESNLDIHTGPEKVVIIQKTPIILKADATRPLNLGIDLEWR